MREAFGLMTLVRLEHNKNKCSTAATNLKLIHKISTALWTVGIRAVVFLRSDVVANLPHGHQVGRKWLGEFRAGMRQRRIRLSVQRTPAGGLLE